MSANFKIGDRVRCITESYDGRKLLNKTGIVVFLYDWPSHMTCVEFDENINGHAFSPIGLNIKKGHTWNVPMKYLVSLKKVLTVKEWKQAEKKK